MPDTTRGVELVRVTDSRASTAHERAFPREPVSSPNDGGESGTVAPAATGGPIMTPANVNEPGQLTSAPIPVAQPWAGWPAEWGTAWQTPQSWHSRVSTVFSCVRVNSSAVSSMTPVLQRGRFPLPRGAEGWRSWTANPQPELYSDWSEFAQQVDVSLEMRGNAYLMPTSFYADGYPRTFYVMDPDLVTPRLEDGIRRIYDARGRDITDDGVLHLRYLTVPGQAAGIGPLQGAGSNLAGAAALEHYAANLARGGGIPWGVIETDQRMSPRQTGLAKQEYLASRADRSGAPAVMPYGMKLNTLTLSPKDMALLDLRVFDEQRIAGAFGVPPTMVNLPAPEGLTYANVVDRRTEHYVGTLRPTASRVATAISGWALPGFVNLRLNASEYLQGTTRDRTETYLPVLQAGVITPEEFRELVGLPPGGDLTTLDAISQLTTGTQ